MKTIHILPVFIGVAVLFTGITTVASAKFPEDFDLLQNIVPLYTVPSYVPAGGVPTGWPSWIGTEDAATSVRNVHTGEVQTLQSGGTWTDGWPSWIGR
ncbi:MAG: hypothetical protein PHE68_03230 [Candidatus Peribacteraceae bacterium]|nr:hypothetical protein [Candidatus Peribacteraceae bacterium]MDD5074896.1 hypothetical protein [Candidatus Peribacteraceae bacterium]